MTPPLLAATPTVLWTMGALVGLGAVVMVVAWLREPDQPPNHLAAARAVAPQAAGLARAADRAVAAALVGTAWVVRTAVVATVRALIATLMASARVTGRAVVVVAISTTRLAGATAVLAVAALSAATLVPPTAGALTGAVHVSNPNPSEDVALQPLEQRSVVLASDGTEVALLHGEHNRIVVALDEIPPLVRAAVITAEDRRFAEHDGFDPHGIARATLANVREGAVAAGGSTITQQLAKASFTDGAQTLDRKLTELAYARALEAQFTKAELLERYLNEVYVGRGAYGMAAGAEAFFGREPAHLEAHQAALLAGMIAAPGHFDPDRNPERARTRRNQVLAGMVEEGHLSQRRAEIAAAQPLDVVSRWHATPRDPYVVEQVKRELLAEPALGETVSERIDALFEGGLEIHTSVDWRLQERAAERIAAATAGTGPTAAVLIMDAATGQILVSRSGQDFDHDQFDPVLQGRRQPGSAFKAFVLAAALERGASLSDTVDASSPASLDFGGVRPWSVRNFGGADLGTLTVQEAFARSSNTAFARLMLEVGQDSVEDVLDRLGVDLDRALGSQRGLSPAIALGGVTHGMTLPEMATAFGALTGDGRVRSAHVVTRVLDADGNELITREAEPRPALDPAVAAQTRSAMRAAVESGTGGRAQLAGREVVGKTGTSQQFADAWFVGEADGLVGAVWVGHPEGRVAMPRVTGGQLPATLWAELVELTLTSRHVQQ